MVVFVALFLERAPEGDIELSCAAVCAGVTASDILSLALMLAFYLGDRRKYGSRTGESIRLTGRMLSVALPLAVSAYARSALSTLEHLLVPRGFRKSGLSADAALAGYGVIQGMAMPVLSFPSCLLSSLAENVIPELTGAQVRGGAGKNTPRGALTADHEPALRHSGGLRALCDVGLHRQRALRLVRSGQVHTPARAADTGDVCGHGRRRLPERAGPAGLEHGINILDAGLGVLLVYTLLPIGALDAYIGIIYFNELLNLALSAARLRRAVK